MIIIAETAYPSGVPEFTLGLSGVRAVRSLVLCVMLVNRCLFFWPLCGLSFDLRILNNTPLVSSNSSCCLTPSDQIFSYIMATANHFWMR